MKKYLKRNKNKHLLIVSTFLSLVSILPITTLTGCSSISQFFIPVVVNQSPFDNGDNPTIIDPYLAAGITKDTKESTTSHSDLIKYLPESYVFTLRSSDTSTNTMEAASSYTYSTKPTFDRAGGDTPFKFDDSDFYGRRWLSSKDDKMSFINKDGSLSSFENLCISAATIGVNTLSYNFLTLLDYLDRYQLKVINNNDDNKVNEYLSAMYANSVISETTGFLHGNKSSQTNKDLYEFWYDKANLLSTGNTHYKYGNYDIEFKIVKSGVNTGLIEQLGENNTPFIKLSTIDLRSSEYGYDVNSDENKDIPYLIPTNENFVGTYKWEGNDKDGKFVWTKPTNASPYLIYSYDNDDKKHETPIDVSSISSIPMLIDLNTVHSAYYDPTQKLSSIYPTDWLIPKKQLPKINESINKTSVWKGMKNHITGDPTVTTLNHTVAFPKSNYEGNYDSWWSDSLRTNKKIDPTIDYWTSNNKHDIQPGQFIALANYAFKDFTYKYKKTDGTYGHFKTKLPYFSGFGSLFPAYFAFVGEGVYKLIDTTEGSVAPKHYIFDFDSTKIKGKTEENLYDIFSKMIKNLTSNVLKPSVKSYSTSNHAFRDDELFLYWWMYGKNDNGDYTKPGVVNSSDFLTKE